MKIVKTCPMCKIEKSSEDFYKNHRDGLSPYCKPCSADRKRKGAKTASQIKNDIYPVAGTKVCSKCKKEKPTSEFNKRVRPPFKDSFKAECKECQSITFKKWAIRTGKAKHNSKQEMLDSKKGDRYPSSDTKLCSCCGEVKSKTDFGRSFAAGGNCKECRGVQSRKLYSENKDKVREYIKSYRENNLQKMRGYANKGAKKRSVLLRAARIYGRATQADKFAYVAIHGYKCMCCGVSENLSFDHVIPVSKGGHDTISNMQILCISCNSSKASKTIDYRPKLKEAA